VPLTLRGRPRQFCTEAALAAALEVFWRKGFEGASLSDLTEAMGITRPSLYAAFGNKEDLFRKALDLYEREKLAFMRDALEAPTAKGVAETILRRSLEMQTRAEGPKGCLNVISTVVAGADAACVREELLARRATSEAALIERFETAAAAGDLPADLDPKALVRYLMAVVQGLGVHARAGAPSEDMRQIVETTLALWPGR